MKEAPDIHQNHLVQMINAKTGERTEPAVLSLADLCTHLKKLEEDSDDTPLMVLVLGAVNKDNEVDYSTIPLMYTDRFYTLVEAETARQGAQANG